MVALFLGRTKCALCGDVIATSSDALGFPAFLRLGHRFFQYSDAAFHKACFDRWPEREPFETLYKKYREIWESRPKNLKTLEEIEAWGRQAFKDL